MGRLGHRRNLRRLWWIVGVVAVAGIAASFGTPKAGCAMSADDTEDDEGERSDAAALAVDGGANVDAARPSATPPSPSSAEASVVTASDGAVSSVLTAIDPSTFCVTAGRAAPAGGTTLVVDSAGMRGVVASDRSRVGQVAFVFRGTSAQTVPLANGELRQQIGLKLRAQDSCNVVYVMWHVAPKVQIAVSVKYNPGQATHAECADRGYINLKPTKGATPPAMLADSAHTLQAAIEGDTLRVRADGVDVWEGTLPPETFAFDGAIGIRSDNVTADFELRLPGGGDPRARCANPGTELAH